jgi:uncharacterized protein (TIGR03067 family)
MRTALACPSLVLMLLLPAGHAAGDGPKEELAALQGTWKLVALESDGETRELPAPPTVWVIRGDKVHYGGAPLAVLHLDASTTPRSVDLHFVKPKKVCEGVYSLKGDTLKLCVNRQAEGVKERPLGFSTKEKGDWRLLVFERQKGKDPEPVGGFVGIAIGLDKERKVLSIGQVLPSSPAMAAGLKKDDVLLKVGGADATDLRGVVALVRQARPGSDLAFRVRRGGEEREIVVRVGVLPFFLLD